MSSASMSQCSRKQQAWQRYCFWAHLQLAALGPCPRDYLKPHQLIHSLRVMVVLEAFVHTCPGGTSLLVPSKGVYQPQANYSHHKHCTLHLVAALRIACRYVQLRKKLCHMSHRDWLTGSGHVQHCFHSPRWCGCRKLRLWMPSSLSVLGPGTNHA